MVDHAFGNVLRKLRNEREMSQEEFGFAAGIHRTYVSQLERGLKSPSLKTLETICDILEIRPSEFMLLLEKEKSRRRL